MNKRVLHCGSIDVKTGGPALSTSLSMKGVLPNGYDALIWQQPLLPGGSLISDEFDVYYRNKIKLKSIKNIDLYHIQGLWEIPNHKMAVYARKNKVPYIITLRGMFYSSDQNVLKKRIALALYQKKDLKMAACIQATCKEEMNEYRKYGLKNPVAVIPNPIDCSEFLERPVLKKSVFRFGYLGRLDKRKRVERIIYSFYHNQSYYNRAELIIIGSWDSQYEKFLKSEVKRLKLKNVIFTGFITGKEKDDYITSLSALVVPSDFENFGNIVTEALVRGVPVIASKGTPWEDLERYKCGFWVENDQNTIDKTMLNMFLLPEEERIQMGINGKKLIEKKFSLEKNGMQLAHLYDWILGVREKPDFVYI